MEASQTERVGRRRFFDRQFREVIQKNLRIHHLTTRVNRASCQASDRYTGINERRRGVSFSGR